MENKIKEPKSLFNLSNKSVIENDIDISCLEHTHLNDIKKYCLDCNDKMIFFTIIKTQKKLYYCGNYKCKWDNSSDIYRKILELVGKKYNEIGYNDLWFLITHNLEDDILHYPVCDGKITEFKCSVKNCPEKCYVCAVNCCRHEAYTDFHPVCEENFRNGFCLSLHEFPNNSIYDLGYCQQHEIYKRIYNIEFPIFNQDHTKLVNTFLSSFSQLSNSGE